jgi:acetolactate synthase-1/2/3 large subunit
MPQIKSSATRQEVAAARLAVEPIGQTPPQPISGARILCEALVREGVDTLFGYPGGAILPIYDELARMREQLHHVLVRHEQGAVHMAEGYSKATGKVGVVLVTSGPGATNAVTGIANAYMDSTPIVVITGQVPRKLIGTDAFQEVDTVGITRPCTKYNYMVRNVTELAPIVHEAFHLARSGRPGPVLIDIPKDVTQEIILFNSPADVCVSGYRPETHANSEDVESAVEKILAAERPVLYVGGGVVHSGAADELLELAQMLGQPVTLTLMALGCFPPGHSLSLGMLGMHGMYAANMAVSEADVLVAIGARFDDRVTGKIDKFAPHAEIVHIDIDPSSVHKNVRAHFPLLGDAKTVLRQMLEALKRKVKPGPERLGAWWKQIREWQKHAPLFFECSTDVIKPQELCAQLYSVTNGEAIIATDVGQHQMWLAQFYGFRGPRQSITSGGLGAMGFGFPAAIGAQIAHPDRQVIAFVGDGGFQMTAQELSTAVQYKTNTKVVIMNNNYLGMVRQWQDLFFKHNYSSVEMEGNPNFVKLAEAYGAKGLRATHPSELRDVLERGLSTPGVVVMDIWVTKEENVYPIIPPGAAAREMILE